MKSHLTTSLLFLTFIGMLFAGTLQAQPNTDTQAERHAKKLLQKARQAKAKKDRNLKRNAKKYRQLKVTGDELKSNIERLTSELTWYTSMEAVKEEAKKQDKPILWLNVLGEIDGFL